MFVLSRKTDESVVVGGEDGADRLPKARAFDAAGKNVKLGFEVDAEVTSQQWEMLERIRVAAGQTS